MSTPNLSLTALNCDKSMVIGTLQTEEINDADYIPFYDVSAAEEPKQRKVSLEDLKNKIRINFPDLPDVSPSDVGKTLVVNALGKFDLGQAIASRIINLDIGSSDFHWVPLEQSRLPYKYYMPVYAGETLSTASVCKLINNDPVLFAKYGFALAGITGENGELDSFILYTIRIPNERVNLVVEING